MSETTKYGKFSLYNNKGSNNSGFGWYAGYNNLDGSCNTAIGSNSLFYNTTGEDNTAVGAGSMSNNQTGSLNTAVGSSALEGTSTNVGNRNVAIGAQALYNLDADCNTSIGTFSGYYNTIGNYNTFIGFNADVSNNGTTSYGTYEYSTAIGYNTTIDASNQIVLGTLQEKVKIPGSYVGIGGNFNPGATYPQDGGTYALDVSGNINTYYINLSSGETYTNNPDGLVPKSYVDSIGSGTTPLEACQCASTGYIDLLVPPTTIDGYTLQNGDRVLLNYQSNINPNVADVSNGIYVVDLYGQTYWTRSSDMTVGDNATSNITFVLYGTTNGGAQFVQTADPGIVGSNALIFNNFGRQIRAGRGLENNNGYFDVDTSLNFINYLDNDSTGPSNPNTLNIGTNTNTVNIGKTNTVISGNVGIGKTASSSYKLDVSGNIYASNSVYAKYFYCNDISGVLGPGSGLQLYQQSSNTFYDNNTSNGTHAFAVNNSSGAQINPLTLTSTKNSMYVPLDVTGNVTATSYTTTSDYRIKENVKELDEKFIIDKLNPVTYLNNNSGKQDIGLIAHELQEIYPELVNGEKDGEQLQSVNYTGLIPILIKEMQNLKKEIRLLKDANK